MNSIEIAQVMAQSRWKWKVRVDGLTVNATLSDGTTLTTKFWCWPAGTDPGPRKKPD